MFEQREIWKRSLTQTLGQRREGFLEEEVITV